MEKRPLANHHLSVDCVVIGFDGKQLKVLLINRAGEDNGEVYHDMKLPGSLIYVDEDLDEAAKRVLFELTGLKSVKLVQFKAFGSKDRTSNPRDVLWLEQTMQLKVERIVTIAYLSLIKIDRTLDKNLDGHGACWVALKEEAGIRPQSDYPRCPDLHPALCGIQSVFTVRLVTPQIYGLAIKDIV